MTEQEFVEHWTAGTPSATIAELLSVTTMTVGRRASRLGLEKRLAFGGRPSRRDYRKPVRVRCPECHQIYEAVPRPPLPRHTCRRMER